MDPLFHAEGCNSELAKAVLPRGATAPCDFGSTCPVIADFGPHNHHRSPTMYIAAKSVFYRDGGKIFLISFVSASWSACKAECFRRLTVFWLMPRAAAISLSVLRSQNPSWMIVLSSSVRAAPASRTAWKRNGSSGG